METKKVKIKEVKLNPKNPRVIRDDKFKKLVKSIQEFPEMLDIRPIVVNEEMVVLGGNMRLKACKEAGLKEIPVLITSLDEAKQEEFIIKDNSSFGDWDWDMLANEWDNELLIEWGIDIPKFEVEDQIAPAQSHLESLEEKYDKYLHSTIKQVVLYFDTDEYEQVLMMLDKIAQENNFEDNSSVVKFLLEKYTN